VYAGHVYCARHIYDNVQRHLTDNGVAVQTRQQLLRLLQTCCETQTADTSAACDDATHQLLEYARLHIPDHADYIAKHVMPKVSNNRMVRLNYTTILRTFYSDIVIMKLNIET